MPKVKKGSDHMVATKTGTRKRTNTNNGAQNSATKQAASNGAADNGATTEIAQTGLSIPTDPVERKKLKAAMDWDDLGDAYKKWLLLRGVTRDEFIHIKTTEGAKMPVRGEARNSYKPVTESGKKALAAKNARPEMIRRHRAEREEMAARHKREKEELKAQMAEVVDF